MIQQAKALLEIFVGLEEVQNPGMVQGREHGDFHSELLQKITLLLGHLPWKAREIVKKKTTRSSNSEEEKATQKQNKRSAQNAGKFCEIQFQAA